MFRLVVVVIEIVKEINQSYVHYFITIAFRYKITQIGKTIGLLSCLFQCIDTQKYQDIE